MYAGLGTRVFQLHQEIVANFSTGDWKGVGLLTGYSDWIDQYPRLLRSLSWGDPDYPGNVLGVLKMIAEADPKAIDTIENYVGEKYPEEGEYISAKASVRKILFAPNVFQVPEVSVEPELVAVMMPFSAEFDPVFAAIKGACSDSGRNCLRADDIWEETAIIQDIFNLVFRAGVVIADFTGKNPNVMYETGIAHTLGKIVVPMSQSLADVPFDMQHHRVQKYLANTQGLGELRAKLTTKLQQLGA